MEKYLTEAFFSTEDDTAQQYVPPSEQRVEEPKKYTGSAIPSRSFKMLQAMTQSDAPGKCGQSTRFSHILFQQSRIKSHNLFVYIG